MFITWRLDIHFDSKALKAEREKKVYVIVTLSLSVFHTEFVEVCDTRFVCCHTELVELGDTRLF